MCGIVGMVMKGNNGLIKRNEDSFFEMLYADAVRGFDSTGVIGVEKDGSFTIAKEAVEATWVIPQIKGERFCLGMYNRGKAWIGHNRKKTVGAIKDETAHPFVVDRFAMVHNGTLYNHKQLADVEVDSQALTIVMQKALSEKAYKPALEETLGKVNGAYALAMYNQPGDAVHLLRNKDRPLCIVEADDAYYFASEPMMALWILCRNGYAYDKLKVKAVPEHTLITFDLLKNTVHEEVLTPKKAYTPQTTTFSGGGATNRYGTGFVPATAPLGDKVTKGNIKFFRRKWLNNRISFWASDWIEENYPRTIERDGESLICLMAQHDDIKEMHDISATADIKKAGLDVEDICDVRWTGIVTEILHNVDTERAVLVVTDVKPVVTSKGVSVSVDDKKAAFRKGLQGKSWVMLKRELEEFKNDLVTWQRDLYHEVIGKKEDEISKISHTMGMNAAIDAYKKKGITLEQQLRQGKCVLVVPETQEVVYESPVSFH